MADLNKVTINVDNGVCSIVDLTGEQAQEIWDRCSSYELMDRALKKMQMMFSKEGTVRVDQCRMREIIRQVYYPDKPCTQCNGVGEIPQIRTPDHGDCKNWESRGPWHGWCKLHKKDTLEETKDICHKFENKFPMQKCPSCLDRPTLREELKNDKEKTN